MKGIAIPIGFEYTYRGRRYGEIELYFSFSPITADQVDLLEPGKSHEKKIKQLLEKGKQGSFDYLFPLPPVKIEKYSASEGMRYSIIVLHKNPTTATWQEMIEFYPCKENNLNTTLKLFNYPDFYLSQKDGHFQLLIRGENGDYTAIPAQKYCPRCWPGFAHPAITVQGNQVSKFSKINWQECLKKILACKPA